MLALSELKRTKGRTLMRTTTQQMLLENTSCELEHLEDLEKGADH